MGKSKTLIHTFSMALCAVFAALLAAGAYIRIPTPFAPITLQAEFAIMAGLILGSRLGAISAALYLIMGILGLPVFAQGGGIGYVFQPTFGYIIGFVIGAYLAGLVVEKSKNGSKTVYFLACLAGLGAIYAAGLVYVWFIRYFYLHLETGLWALIMDYFLLPLPGDILLCAGAGILARRIKPVTMKYFGEKAAD